MNSLKRICINCGSSPGLLPEYMECAQRLGAYLAGQKIEIVYGGADVGLMGAVANAALENNGVVIGVIPKSIRDKVGHKKLSKLHTVGSMHERKQLMFDLSDAFIALPGGFGTLDEILEILTWSQLGFHSKPCGFLNIAGYYDRLISFLDYSVQQRFVKQLHRDSILVAGSPEELHRQFMNYKAPAMEKWLDRRN